MAGFNWALPLIQPPRVPVAGDGPPPAPPATATPAAATGGVREQIDDRYRERYERWKAEWLSTEAGRNDWNRYANDPNFTLTIVMSEARENAMSPSSRSTARQGAVASEGYRWNESGKLVGATIYLGSDLNHGQPAPENYPITSTLGSGNTLAAAKLAHEVGHVEQTASLKDEALTAYRERYALDAELKRVYAETHDVKNPEFVRLSAQIAAYPDDSQFREHQAERNVISFLEEKQGRRMPRDTREAIDKFNADHAQP